MRTVYADFQNADRAGRVRLNSTGSLRDLEVLGNELSDGLAVLVESEDLRAHGVLRWSTDEHLWVVEIDWSKVDDR